MIDAGRFSPPAALGRLNKRALLIGAVAALISVAGLFLDRTQFFRSYLVAWLFWMGIAMGGFATMMLHHMSSGAWGLMIRRIFEAAARTLPAIVVLFLPILFGMEELFPWARAEATDDPVLQVKAWYLNSQFFTLRAFLCFAIWGGFIWALLRLSKRQDEAGDPRLFRKMQSFAGPGLGIYGLTATFASVDWLMSLDPHWYSSLFGVYFIGGQAVAAMAFAILMVAFLARREPMQGTFRPQHYHDYGNLLFAFVLLWSYFGLSQFLIIWMGNLPEETAWYLHRQQHGWIWVSLALVIFHFAVPFALLLSRKRKRNIHALAKVAILLLVMHWIDLFWQAGPAFSDHPGSGSSGYPIPHWLDLTTLAAVGGLWFAAFTAQLNKHSLLPVGEPHLEEALEA
ncbi:MAG: hypothetical protein GY769_24160 [bacterium]|nr:hypothetical protein [bacterium]